VEVVGSVGAGRASTPFAEPEVERLLITHLQGKGYRVNQRQHVHSGIIDVAATGADGNWLIEVKGEDRGGYNSAQMNFQMGIGQIMSRMTDPDALYAVAIPVTHDYLRVLRKFKGSLGFGPLKLFFFLVHRDGKVERYDAPEMSAYIGKIQP
jgi:hypothetical protein